MKPDTCGVIYSAKSPSGKFYIGMTIGPFLRRQRQHIYYAVHEKNYLYQTKLSKAIRKYGQLMEWSILYQNVPGSKLNDMEVWIIAAYNSFADGYNSTPGGAGRQAGSPLSEETRKKMSASRMGLSYGPLSQEHRAKLSKSHMGFKHTQAMRDKVSASLMGHTRNLGKKDSPETLARKKAAQSARRARERAAREQT